MPVIKKCICGKKFKTFKSRVKDNRGKFCSKKCHYKNAKRPSGLQYKIKIKNKGWFKKGSTAGKHKHHLKWNKNPRFKNGIWSYREEAKRKGMGKKCELCGSKKNIYIHHKDHNRKNNNFKNWMSVCSKCHTTKLHPRKFYGNQYKRK